MKSWIGIAFLCIVSMMSLVSVSRAGVDDSFQEEKNARKYVRDLVYYYTTKDAAQLRIALDGISELLTFHPDDFYNHGNFSTIDPLRKTLIQALESVFGGNWEGQVHLPNTKRNGGLAFDIYTRAQSLPEWKNNQGLVEDPKTHGIKGLVIAEEESLETGAVERYKVYLSLRAGTESVYTTEVLEAIQRLLNNHLTEQLDFHLTALLALVSDRASVDGTKIQKRFTDQIMTWKSLPHLKAASCQDIMGENAQDLPVFLN